MASSSKKTTKQKKASDQDLEVRRKTSKVCYKIIEKFLF